MVDERDAMSRDAVAVRTLDVLGAIWRTALVVAVALALAAICRAPTALASSNGSISLSTYSGPVGTQVTAALNISINPPATYVLDTTETSPDGGGCDTASPIPGVAPVSVGPNGGVATFAWPSSLDRGPYWLCATSQDGTPGIHSKLPFTVTNASGATATSGAPNGEIVIGPSPSGAFVPGSSLTASFSTDDTVYGNTPLSVSFVSLASGAAILSTYTILSAAGTTYTASIPIPDLAPGQYTLLIEGPEINGGRLASNPIMVVASTPTPTPLASPTPAPLGTQAHTLPPSPDVSGGVIAAIAAGMLLAVSLVLLIVPPLRRRGNQTPR